MNELMDDMVGFAYYSILDGFSSYYSIELDEKSIPLIAFRTPRGIVLWTVLPFGFKNAPSYLHACNGSGDGRVADRGVCGRHWLGFLRAV